jgi:predicted nucleotidyltransferase
MECDSMQIAPNWRALVERVLATYREALGSDLLAVACFGSVARGEADPESDLDLYVVTRNRVSSLTDPRLRAMSDLRDTLEYQRLVHDGYRPDPMPIFHSAAKLATHPWILLDIAHHGVILYDPEGLLARELEAVRRRLRQLGSQRIQRPDGTWYWDLKPDWRPGETITL